LYHIIRFPTKILDYETLPAIIRSVYIGNVGPSAILPAPIKTCPAPEQDTISTVEPVIKTETVLTGYEIIWGMDFLPDGDMLIHRKERQTAPLSFRKRN
jgi:glucose/arabinose dehydrogenase